jgi:PTS system N-acetylgalactosamine-specific IIA component
LATTLVSEATTALQQFKATAEDADEEDDI